MTDPYSTYRKTSAHDNAPTATKSSIKIAFKMKKGETINVSEKHREILVAMADADCDATIFDKDNNPIKLSHSTNLDTKFNYESFPRKHFQLMCVSHTIATVLSLSNLKTSIRNVLASCRATITVNTWNTLDVRDVGWLLQVNPRTHNREHIALCIRQAIQQLSTNAAPKFHLYVKTITNGKPSDKNRTSIPAVIIECASSSIIELRELLHKAYSQSSNALPGKFVPTNFQHIQSIREYTQLLLQQKQYLELHRNISVSNINLNDLQTTITHENKNSSILNALTKSNLVTWISPDNSSETIDKINISTTVTSYVSTCDLLKTVITSNIPNSIINTKYDESIPSHAPPQISTTTKNYLSALTTNLPPPPHTPSPSTNEKHSHTITSTNVSSITSPTTRITSNVQIDNIKEHISRSLTNLRKEFQLLQNELRNEIKQLRIMSLDMNAQSQSNPSPATAPELTSTISSIKHDFESFRSHIQTEMKKQLQTTISTTIKTTTENLTNMITVEVERALRTQLKAMSPRNRKPKRSRAPNIDDSISQQLFSARSRTDTEDDDYYELSNSLFEANMTIRPHSPDHSNSDIEEEMHHQP